jgi:DNA-binding transcriptional LysR family regulator
VRWFLVATPAYLRKRGRPRSPEDLEQRDCLLFGAGSSAGRVQLEKGDRTVTVAPPVRLLVSDMDVLEAAAVAGLGIALLPAFRCVEALRARRLECVLRDWNAPSIPMQVVYPSTRHLSPKVKSFIDHVQERMSPPPWELGPMP